MKKKIKKRKRAKDITEKVDEISKNKKIKTMIDFDHSECNSIKSIAIKKYWGWCNNKVYQRKNVNVCKNFLEKLWI